jgi:hypothetical protein
MSVTPSLPQKGRQPKGCTPLTPFSWTFPAYLLSDYRNVGDAIAAGAEPHGEAPKSLLITTQFC